MNVIVWIVEGIWPACVDAARAYAPDGADIVLLHVTGQDAPAAAHGAYAGLFGRGHSGRDPGTRVQALAAAAEGAGLPVVARRSAAHRWPSRTRLPGRRAARNGECANPARTCASKVS